jgi:hypothetical protein
MIDFAEIRKEIAAEHNLLIGRDDPIVMSVTFNKVIFERYIKLLIETNTEFLAEVTDKQEKRDSDARLRMTRMVSDTGNYLEERMSTGLIDATKDLVAKHKKDLGEAWVQIELSRKTVIACAVLTVFSTIVSVGVLFKAVT